MQDQERSVAPLSLPSFSQQPVRPRAERVLVIEDDLEAAHTLATVLRGLGHTVQFAIHARAGLEMAGRLHPTVVFLGQVLPDMDAYELARRLRAEAQLPPRVMVIASGAVDPAQAREAGCEPPLLKPLKAALIEAALAANSTP